MSAKIIFALTIEKFTLLYFIAVLQTSKCEKGPLGRKKELELIVLTKDEL